MITDYSVTIVTVYSVTMITLYSVTVVTVYSATMDTEYVVSGYSVTVAMVTVKIIVMLTILTRCLQNRDGVFHVPAGGESGRHRGQITTTDTVIRGKTCVCLQVLYLSPTSPITV